MDTTPELGKNRYSMESSWEPCLGTEMFLSKPKVTTLLHFQKYVVIHVNVPGPHVSSQSCQPITVSILASLSSSARGTVTVAEKTQSTHTKVGVLTPSEGVLSAASCKSLQEQASREL